MVANIEIHSLRGEDLRWVREMWERNWGGDTIVTRGRIHRYQEVSGLVARVDDEPVGLLTYVTDKKSLEIITLDSMMEGVGIGTQLIDRCLQFAKDRNIKRIWLVTTNDNTDALRFYQRRGFSIAAFHKDAMREARKLKRTIPQVGMNGIPLRDEIELEYLL